MESGGGTTKIIPGQVVAETLKKDLENYRQRALELGASQAEVIPAPWVQIDERVRLKCSVPRCHNYGRCAYCPPYTPEPEFMRKALDRFQWAVFFRKDVVPVEDYARIARYSSHGARHSRSVLEIVAKIEIAAFADGYYLALGFGCGSCRSILCDGMLCQVIDSGQCRFPLKSRPSMEAVGIDVYGLVTRLGWEICPIYNGVDAEQVTRASSAGIVFVH